MISITPAMQLVMDLSRLQVKVLKRVDSGLGMHGISFTEFLVMYQLSKSPANTLRRIDLAERIGLSASGITRLLIPMEKIGLVKKEENPRDARVSLVRLSKAGAQLLEDASVSFGYSADSIVQAIDDRQLKQVTQVVEKLL
jgi:DNA-binding MarR family transcriptional regulator